MKLPIPGHSTKMKKTKQFLILMIPAVYRNNQKPSWDAPDAKAMEPMGKFNDRVAKRVKILSLNGLHPLTSGARLTFAQGKPLVTDGPYVETKEVLGGYWMVEAKSQTELVKLWQDCPAEKGDIIEIRQIFGPEDFAPKK